MDERERTPELQRPRSAGLTFPRALGWMALVGWRGARGLGRTLRQRPRLALGVLSVLLLIVAFVPQLRLLGATPQPHPQVRITPTATPMLAPADPPSPPWNR